MKSGFVAVVGRPSCGKSSLVNSLCGYKISIVAETPQTTRRKVRAILNDARGQIVFLDTPGMHMSEKKMNLYLKEQVFSSLEEADGVLYVCDLGRTPGIEEEFIVSVLKERGTIPVIALNKCDLEVTRGEEYRAFLADKGGWSKSVAVSAETGENLPLLLDALFDSLSDGELLYPPEFYTDQTPEFRITEIIREKAINRVRQELPHALYVEISDLEEREKDSWWIRAFIVAERESQKGILIGRGGEMIKSIRQSAQKELMKIFGRRIHLDLRVKIRQKWRRDDSLLKSFFRD